MEAMMANSTMSITMGMMWVAAATAITLALRMFLGFDIYGIL